MTTPPPHAAKVIIVDDATSVRSMLRTLLGDEGYQVLGDYASGSNLVETVGNLRPDIVCLDYNLPDSNGLDLLRAIHSAYPAIGVVMITGNTDPGLDSAVAEAGAAGFIRKPFSADRVLKELQQVVQAQRLIAAAAKARDAVTVRTARARAVIADDSATMRQLLKAILEHAAIEVVGEAWDGKQAVELAAKFRPDIVCLDLDMPVMNGLEALPAIHAGHPAAKVLMITGHASRESIMQAGKLGARGYILKPFRPDKVIEALDKLLT